MLLTCQLQKRKVYWKKRLSEENPHFDFRKYLVDFIIGIYSFGLLRLFCLKLTRQDWRCNCFKENIEGTSARQLGVPMSFWKCLAPSHTKRPSVGFRAARQRRYKILLLRQVCGVCADRKLVLISAAWRQKHASRGIEPVLFLTPDAWCWPIRARTGGSYSGLMSKQQNSLI